MEQSQQLLNFRVRKELVVHRRRLITRSGVAGKSFTEMQTSSHGDAFGNPEIALEPHEVRAYAHALEPTDEASAAALEALHFKPPVRGPELSYEEQVTRRAVNATIAALVASGIVKPASGK